MIFELMNNLLLFIYNFCLKNIITFISIDHRTMIILVVAITPIFYYIYRFLRFNEIVVKSIEEVPNKLRILPDQRLPPFYPNGWIPVLESHKLNENELKSITCFGRELVITRAGHDVYCFDAYCPHLGANLAIGGVVEMCRQKTNAANDNDEQSDFCVRCPFHSWAFRLKDGKCVDVPYEAKAPNAKLKLWECIEVNNFIFVWYHSNGEQPHWYPEEIEPIKQNEWTYCGRTEHHVNCHIQEIPENGADVAHLNAIHSDAILSGSGLLIDSSNFHNSIINHRWIAEWSVSDDESDEKHVANLRMKNITTLFNCFEFEFDFKIKQIGPAYVEIHFQCKNLLMNIEGCMLQMVLPTEPMKNIIVHNFYFKNSFRNWLMSKFFIYSEDKMIQRDIRIWNRKAFLRRPFLGKSEASILKFRRWYRQFYSENDENNNNINNNDALDW